MADDVQDETDDIRGEVNGIAKEAQESLGEGSLIDRIKNRKMRTVKLDLGYDEVNSEKLAVAQTALDSMQELVERGDKNIAKAVEWKKARAALKHDLKTANPEEAGEIEEKIESLSAQIDATAGIAKQLDSIRGNLEALSKEIDETTALVRADSLSVELRALPYTIARGAARRARKHLGITEKGIPEDRQDEFADRQLMELAYDQVVRWRDNKTGDEGTKLDMSVIEALRDFLPLSQSGKFFAAVDDLQFRNSISEAAIKQTDF